MTDPFESRLREAFHQEAARIPFSLEVATVQDRIRKTERSPRSLLWAFAPVITAVVAAVAILWLFPGPDDGDVGFPSPRMPTALPSLPDPVSGRPTEQPTPAFSPAPAARSGPSIAVEGGLLFMAGGSRGTQLTSVYVFEASDHTWTALPSLPELRARASAVVLSDGSLLLAGGRRADRALDDTILLQPGSEEWIPYSDLPYPQSSASAARVGDQVYLIGGAEPGHQQEMAVLSEETGEWTRAASLPVPLIGSSAVALDGRLYVLGGRDSAGNESAAAYEYAPSTDTWKVLANMPNPTATVGATAAEGYIWVFGPDSRAFAYDVIADAWTILPRYARPGMSWYAPIPTEDRIIVASGSSGAAGAGVDAIGLEIP